MKTNIVQQNYDNVLNQVQSGNYRYVTVPSDYKYNITTEIKNPIKWNN